MDGIAAALEPGQEGSVGSPALVLDGFTGPLERLLALARARQVDIARLSLLDLCAQLSAAIAHARGAVPLGQQGEWLVMGAWLLQLRSRLLLPGHEPAIKAAEAAADRLRGRLDGLRDMQALAAWLERRPQPDRYVFARGQPDWAGPVGGTAQQVDVVEFLWAAMALFDADLPAAETAPRYRPVWFDLYAIRDARARIRRLMAACSGGTALAQLLPEPAPDTPPNALKQRSAWTSTFVASLELAKQGEVALQQERAFAPTQVHLVADKPVSQA